MFELCGEVVLKLIRDDKIIKEVRTKNLIMDRMIDRLVAVISQSRSSIYGLNFVGVPYIQEDELKYQHLISNILHDFLPGFPGVGGPLSLQNGTIPELIGLGEGNTLPHKKDLCLETPIPSSFRNTLNSKEGGAFTQETNYVIRCGAIWDDTFSHGQPIREIGLFYNIWMVSKLPWVFNAVSGNWEIDIRGAGLQNKAWEILNITGMLSSINGRMCVFQRNDVGGVFPWSYSWDRNTQIITFNGTSLMIATNSNLITFCPRYDHLGNPVEGAQHSFIDPSDNSHQLYARVVLPDPITKTVNDTLTIDWLIYFKQVA